MKNIAIYIVFLGLAVFHISNSMEKLPDLEKLRPGCIFEKTETDSLPKLSSAKECYELCHSLLKSEINFWRENKKSLIEENVRLAVILNLLEKSAGTQEVVKKGTLTPLNLSKKLGNLELRMKIFSNPKDSSDTTNKDLYDIYNSYNVIETKLYVVLAKYETYGSKLPKEAQQIEYLETVKKELNQISQEITKELLLIRGLMHSSSLGKSIPQIVRSEKGHFQADVGTAFGSYAYCDVEYISEIVIPTLSEIINSTQETLASRMKPSKVRQPIYTGTIPNNDKRKRKKQPRRGAAKGKVTVQQQESVDQKSEPSGAIETVTSIVQPVIVQPQSLQSSRDLKVEDEQISVSLPIQNSIVEPSIDTEQQEVFAEEQKKSIGIDAPQGTFGIVEAQYSSPVPQDDREDKSVPEADDTVGCDIKPWEQYAKKTSVGIMVFSDDDKLQNLSFKLSEDDLYTAMLLLGLLDNGREKLEMTSFMKFVKVGLKGAVIDRKKCIYFMAPSILDQTWHSVAMHRLHKDDAHIIPRNTRYWKIAKQLLIDVGLSESNLRQ